jgi:predicted RNA-binding protein YlxR (DUF448 family)
MAQDALDRGPIGVAAAPAAAIDGARPDAPALGAGRARKPQERSCIVTRLAQAPGNLVRFVVSPEGVVTPDIRRALPGRGVWVTARRTLIAEAVKRKAFARAFRKEVTAPADLPDTVGALLRKDALQALSLANKAGAVIAGFEKVRQALAAGEVLALVEASDGSPDGRRKLVGAARTGAGAEPAEAADSAPVLIDCFVSTELDLALGRPHVIHAALLEVPASGFALTKCLRFHRFELIEKHASGSAARRGAAQEHTSSKRRYVEPPFEPSDRAAGQKSE